MRARGKPSRRSFAAFAAALASTGSSTPDPDAAISFSPCAADRQWQRRARRARIIRLTWGSATRRPAAYPNAFIRTARAAIPALLAAAGIASLGACSPSPHQAATEGPAGAGAEETRTCNWETRTNSGRSVSIGRLLAANDDGADEADELCRAIAAIHRGPSLLIATAPFSVRDIDAKTRACLADRHAIVLGQIESSSGDDMLHILSAIAHVPSCWATLAVTIDRKFGAPGGGSRPLIAPGALLQSLESRRSTSAISQMSVYDDVARAIPIGVYVAADQSVEVRCLLTSAQPGPELPSGKSSWRDCLRRMAG